MPNDRNNDYETAYYNAEEVRRQSAAGGPKKKKKKSKRANQRLALYLACVVLGSCLLAGIGWLLFNEVPFRHGDTAYGAKMCRQYRKRHSPA